MRRLHAPQAALHGLGDLVFIFLGRCVLLALIIGDVVHGGCRSVAGLPASGCLMWAVGRFPLVRLVLAPRGARLRAPVCGQLETDTLESLSSVRAFIYAFILLVIGEL